MNSASTFPFVRLEPLETHIGLPIVRRTPTAAGSAVPLNQSARAVLEEVLEDAVSRNRCYVTFSGGRDSSALLALATHVARRMGAPAPIAVTAVHPDAPRSQEAEWQRRVIDYLGVKDWIVVTVRGEQRLLGSAATEAIRTRGIAWPEAVQFQAPLLSGLEVDCALVSGEGGDQVIAGGRAAPLRNLVRSWPPRRTLLRATARALDPRTTRAIACPWHTAEAVERYRCAVGGRDPVRWNRRTSELMKSAVAQVFFPNIRACIAENGLRPVVPFVEERFLRALAHEGGPLGLGSRGQLFEYLVGDLLPRDVLYRRSKASFNETRWGEVERQFARSWDGTGFDSRWVDPERLQHEWLSASPHPVSDFMLQVAWAAANGYDAGLGGEVEKAREHGSAEAT